MIPKKHTAAWLAVLALVFSAGRSEPQESSFVPARVSVSSVIQSNRVPLNRTVDLTIRIAWEGPAGQIVINDLVDPVFSNLEVTGTSSSNRVSGMPGRQSSVKDIVYTLRPKTLGMAYIDPATLSYTDTKTGLVQTLQTRRMGVEAIAPVPEKGGGAGAWFRVFFGILFAAGAVFGGWLFIRRRKSRWTQQTAVPIPILEEDFLDQLKSSVDLASADRRESFSALSKLFKRYLAAEYHVAAAGATTPDLVRMLAGQGADEGLLRKCESILSKADVVQFSGKDAAQPELDEAYTFVETVLESRLAEERTRRAQAKADAAEGKKSGFFKWLRKK